MPNLFEIGLKCVTATYSIQSDDRIGVVNRGVRMYPWPKRVKQIHGTAIVPNTNEPAKLKVIFDNVPGMGDYWVLDTDYQSWAVVYSPSNSNFKLFPPGVFILARDPFPTKQTVRAALNLLAIKTGILAKDLIFTKQEAGNC